MKRIIATIAVIAIAASVNAQRLFEGVATYRMSMNGSSATSVSTTYYRGQDKVTDMPQNKMKTIFLAEKKMQYAVMGMMGKPIVSSQVVDPDTMSAPLFEIASGLETVGNHRCLRVSYETPKVKVTTWLDTAYRIPFHYALDDAIPYGLPVRTETRMQMNGMAMETVSELVAVVAGGVDDALFAVPSTDGAVTLSADADGKPVLHGDTTGLYAPVHTERLVAVDSAGFRAAVAKGRVVCMLTATWCGPCRLMYPRLDAVAQRIGNGVRFVKFDIDQSPALARELGAVSIPVVILFDDGRELRRLISAAHSEDDLLRFVRGED